MKTAPLRISFFLVAIFVVTAAVTPGHAETFNYEPIIQNIIWNPSLAIDASGDAHLGYYYVSNNGPYGVAYARRHQGTWSVELVDQQSVYDVALALDPAGNPHIAYYAAVNPHVVYASRIDGHWVSEPVDEPSDMGGRLSLAFDGQGRPHIAYAWNNALKHAVRTDAGWALDVVDPAIGTTSYPGVSLKVDGLGRPCVSYHGGSTIWFARQTGAGWNPVPVASSNAYIETSLALDAQGIACFAYPMDQGLRLARESAGGSWTTERVDSAPAVGTSPSLALDPAGNARIGYYDATNGALRYARWTGTEWSITVVDDRHRSGQRTALALDGAGHAALAYTFNGYTGGSFKFASEVPAITAVGDEPGPGGLALAPPVPSPATDGRATLSFRLVSPQTVSFALYNVAGRRVAARAPESFPAGAHTLRWDAGDQTSGVYFVRLETEAGVEAERRWVIVR